MLLLLLLLLLLLSSKFAKSGSYNENEKEGSYQQRRMEKKNKIKTLGTEKYEHIDTLYINKIRNFFLLGYNALRIVLFATK